MNLGFLFVYNKNLPNPVSLKSPSVLSNTNYIIRFRVILFGHGSSGIML